MYWMWWLFQYLSILCIGFNQRSGLTRQAYYSSLSILCIGFIYQAYMKDRRTIDEPFNSLYWIRLTTHCGTRVLGRLSILCIGFVVNILYCVNVNTLFQFFVLDSSDCLVACLNIAIITPFNSLYWILCVDVEDRAAYEYA